MRDPVDELAAKIARIILAMDSLAFEGDDWRLLNSSGFHGSAFYDPRAARAVETARKILSTVKDCSQFMMQL